MKITYLIGAGASATTIPTVNDLGRDIFNLADRLSTKFGYKDVMGNRLEWNGKFESLNDIEKDLINLYEKISLYGTIDTYAKYLLIKKDYQKISDLKKLTTFYFLCKQFIVETSPDPRYLSFFVSIMDQIKIPEDIKILTWNYDMQMEITLHEHFSEILPNVYPNKNIHSKCNAIDIIHLNGVAGIYLKDNSTWLDAYDKIKGIERDADKLLGIYELVFKEKNENLLTFAFEKEFEIGSFRNSKVLDKACELIEGTSILVVIGYSFPFFNRSIDNELFKIMKKNDTLKKIYCNEKDTAKNMSVLKNQFDLGEDVDIEMIYDINRFYLPFEL